MLTAFLKGLDFAGRSETTESFSIDDEVLGTLFLPKTLLSINQYAFGAVRRVI